MGKSYLKGIIILLICFFIILPSSFESAEANNNPEAINGMLDLANWNWEQDGIVSLKGEWEFYWQQLLTPEDFHNRNLAGENETITVPSTWNNHKVKGKEITGIGYGTYRLLVNASGNQMLGVKIPKIFTSYNLWINGELVATYETVNIQNKSVPNYYPRVIYFKPDTDTLEFIFQVANYRHRSGGIAENVLLGTGTQINNSIVKNIAFDLFLFGSIFIIGFYHLAFFIFRPKDKSSLYFGLFSVLISLRTLFVGEIYFLYLFPSFSWEIAHKIHTLTYYIGVPIFIMLIKSIFPNYISKIIIYLVNIVGLGFALIVLLTPTTIFTYVNPIYQLFTLVLVPYVLYILFTACSQRREGSIIIAIGAGILILATINDIIYLSVVMMDSQNLLIKSIITKGNLSSWGLLAFVFAQSLVLAKNFAKSFARVELMTEKFQRLNESLEEKVTERTQDLETSKKELEKAYQAVSRSEKSRQHLVQNISHDLRTPLTAIQGYVCAILDGIVKEPKQQLNYLDRVIKKVAILDQMVKELLELSKLESRQLQLNVYLLPLKLFVEQAAEKYSLDMRNTIIEFKVNFPSELKNDSNWAKDLFAKVDMDQLDRVFANLFSNALNHTTEGCQVELTFKLTEDNKKLLIIVTDTGVGISENDLPHVFERFYKVSKARQTSHQSSGLGLAIAKEIVEYHGGEIWAESNLGQGSSFFFTLPIHVKSDDRL
ncbi:MAG: 7TM diverse intracellular signaling domain-containing protein [Bacillota bacterium]|nr:7TM diverse intracellular signaling domain-containing protein [Bacillota bacterium]